MFLSPSPAGPAVFLGPLALRPGCLLPRPVSPPGPDCLPRPAPQARLPSSAASGDQDLVARQGLRHQERPPPGLVSSSARHPSRPAATEPTCSSRSRTTCSRSEIQHSPPRSSPGEAFSYPPVPNCLPRTHPSFFAVSSPVPPPVACPCAHFVFLLLAPRLPFALPSLSNCFVAACPSFSHLSCCICMFSRLVPSGLRLSGAAAPVLVLRVGIWGAPAAAAGAFSLSCWDAARRARRVL